MGTLEEVSFNVVKTITVIAKKLEDSQLDDKLIKEIKKPLLDLSNYLNGVATDSYQAIIFAIIFVLSSKYENIEFRQIIGFLNKNDIEKLLELNLIEIEKERRNRNKNKKSNFLFRSYSISEDVSESIYSNETYSKKGKEKLDIYEFVKIVSDNIDQRGNDQLETIEMFDIIELLEDDNDHIKSIKKVQSLLEIEDRALLYNIINDHIIGYPSSMEKTLRDIFQNPRRRMSKVREIVEKTNKMFELEFITLGESKFANDFTLNLTNNAIELFMQEDAVLFIRNKKNKNLLLNEDIAYKELFYEPNLGKEVNFITEILKVENFKKLQGRLVDNNLSKGVAVIFFGTPGTGKTETAFQISKITGRNIMIVDISQTKSMWFGESEKIIKEIFDNYRKICNASEIKPILLFNECDSILNKRQENSHSNVGQTENAIQNILLEEMEKFEGILIATTNLQKSLDAAYERRFLFKIKFENPTIEVKSRIWKSKLDWIDIDFAVKLATEFCLSGGEIDNVVRKIMMQEVLLNIRPEPSEIYSFCIDEKKLSNKNRVKIGY